jgi:hypothetical protein
LGKLIFGKTTHWEGCSFYLCGDLQQTLSTTGINFVMKYRLALALVALAALTRLLPHPHNFTPIGAIALFGAAYFNRQWLMLAVPFAALFLTDLFINNVIYREMYGGQFQLFTSVWIYAAFALVMLAGTGILRNKVTGVRVLGASISASAIFFLVTNFSVWAESGMYPKTAAGLAACYTAGIPFLGNTILGDLFFSVAMFGVYEWAKQKNQSALSA